MPRQINTQECNQCGTCVQACPVEAIIKSENHIQINPDECVDCATCWRICPEKCVDGGPYQYNELKSR